MWASLPSPSKIFAKSGDSGMLKAEASTVPCLKSYANFEMKLMKLAPEVKAQSRFSSHFHRI